MVKYNFVELSNEQRRQLIDAQQAFLAWRKATIDLEKLGSLRKQSSKGKQYIYHVRGSVKKSKGPVTPFLLREMKEHEAHRSNLQDTVKTVAKRLDEMAPVNRALGLGRLRKIAARILRMLDREKLLGQHVIVAGTNALHAYETAAGVSISSDLVATTDADLIWDTRESLSLAATGIPREGLLGLLRRVDHSFHADYRFNATNNDGYIVDLLCSEAVHTRTMRAGADLEATPMPGIDWLLVAPRFEQIIIGEDGWPLRIVVPEPRTFALHKLWVSRRDDRQSLKRPRDEAHSKVVVEIVNTYMRQPFKAEDMQWLPTELKELIPTVSKHQRKK